MLARSVGSKVARRATAPGTGLLQTRRFSEWRAPGLGARRLKSPTSGIKLLALSQQELSGRTPAEYAQGPAFQTQHQGEKCLNHQVNSAGRFPKGKSLRLLRGKKKLPIQSGIWDVLCRCLQLKLTKGSQPAFDYSNRLPLLRIAQLVSKAGVGLTF